MRRIIGNKVVAKGIALAMAAMLAVTPLSAAAVDDHGMKDKFGDESPVAVETYEKMDVNSNVDAGLVNAVSTAKEAAETAKESAKEVTGEVDAVTDAVRQMTEAATAAETKSGEISETAKQDETTANTAAKNEEKLEQDAKNYNDNAGNFNHISTDSVKADAEHIAEIAEDAKKAKDALDEALKVAVDEKQTHSYEEAEATLKDVIKNAQDVEKSYNKVNGEYQEAEKNMDFIIATYNQYAKELGLAQYVKQEDGSYALGEAPAESAVDKLTKAKQEVLSTQLDDIEDAVKQFNKLTDAYDEAKEKEANAEGKLAAAKEKYGKDYQAVENAVNKANNYFVDQANAALDKATANQAAKQAVVNAKNEVLAEATKKVGEAAGVAGAKNATLKQVEKEAEARAEAAYDAIIKGYDDKISELEASKKGKRLGQKLKIDKEIAEAWAKKLLAQANKQSTIEEAYNDDVALKAARSEASQAQGALNNAKAEKESASKALEKANKELETAANDVTDKRAVVEAKKELRDAFLAAFEASYKANNDNGTAFKEQKDGEVAQDKEDAKQVSYDKAVNKWANEVDEYAKEYLSKLIRFKFKDAKDIRTFANDMREYLLKTYTKEAKWKEFLDKNTSFLQAFASTKDFDRDTTALLDSIMKELNQDDTDAKMADANISKNELAAIDKVVDAKVKELTGTQATIEALDKKIQASKDVVKDAQETYDTAKETLKNAKENAEKLVLTKAEAEALQAKIKKAQQDLKDAKEALQTAKENVEKMKIAKEWAEHLSNGLEKMSVSVQQKMDKDGNNLGINATANEAHYNEDEFEAGTKETIDKNPAKFIRLVEYKDAKVGNVPFEIFQKFVKLSYVDNEQPMKYKDSWYYINIDKDLKHSPVLYWVLDKDGEFTGKFIKDEAELVDGQTYYVAYAFKKVQAQYHLDGYMFTYVKPVEEEGNPNENNDTPNNDTPNNDTPSNDTPNNDTPNNTTIEEQETPLNEQPEIEEENTKVEDTEVEDTEVENTQIEDEDVAKSDAPTSSKATKETTDIEDEEAPLSDNPMTGDSLPIAWAGLGLLGLAGITGVILSNKKKEN